MTTMTGLGVALTIGATVVAPLGLRLVEPRSLPTSAWWRRATLATVAKGMLVGVSLLLPVGWFAGLLIVPWVWLGSSRALGAVVEETARRSLRVRDVRHAESAALVFLAVAPLFTLADRLGLQPFGVDPTIVRLTAIHFVYAGFALPLVGAAAWRLRPVLSAEVALGLIVLGIPLTALGFLGFPIANWMGAMLVAAGGIGIGVNAARGAGGLQDPERVWMLRLGGGALLVSMPLAGIYASGTFLGIGVIDVPTMARVHGTVNAFGFALPSLVALNLRPRRSMRPAPVSAGTPQ